MKLLISLAALALSAAPALAGGYYGHAGYGDGYYGGGETVVVTTRRVIHHAPPPPPVHVTRVVRYGTAITAMVPTAAGEAPTGGADGAIAHTSVTTDGATVPMSATTACVAASTGERRIAPLTDLGQPHASPRGSGARGRRFAGVTPGGAPTCPRNTARSSQSRSRPHVSASRCSGPGCGRGDPPGPPVQYAHAREGHRAGAALGVDRSPPSA